MRYGKLMSADSGTDGNGTGLEKVANNATNTGKGKGKAQQTDLADAFMSVLNANPLYVAAVKTGKNPQVSPDARTLALDTAAALRAEQVTTVKNLRAAKGQNHIVRYTGGSSSAADCADIIENGFKTKRDYVVIR